MFVPPLFATSWKFKTVEESNDKGTWFNYAIEKIGVLEDRNLMLEAKAFRDSVVAGEVKAAAEEGASTPSTALKDDEIPF